MYVVGVGVSVAVLLVIIIAVAVFAVRKSRTLGGANRKTTRAASVVTFEMVCGVVWGIVCVLGVVCVVKKKNDSVACPI